MQHRGLSKLVGLNYRIKYKNEVDNKVVDALSRMIYFINEIDHELQVVSEIISQWVTNIQESYISDSWIASLREKMYNHHDDTFCKITEYMRFWRYKGKICVDITGGWRHKIITELYASHLGGHSGLTTTYHRIKRNFC
jgi:hypothetical protein